MKFLVGLLPLALWAQMWPFPGPGRAGNGGAAQTATLIHSYTGSASSTGTSLQVTITGTTAGSLILAFLQNSDGNPYYPASVTDGAAQSYSSLFSGDAACRWNEWSALVGCGLFYAVNSAAGVTTLTFTTSYSGTGRYEYVILEYGGVATTSPLHQSAALIKSATSSWESSTITTTVPTLLVGLGQRNNPATIAASGSWTQAAALVASGRTDVFFEHQLAAAAGTYKAQGTAATAIGTAVFAFTLR